MIDFFARKIDALRAARAAEKKATVAVTDEHVELRGIVASLAEVEWLLLILVMLYYVAPGTSTLEPAGMVASMIAFAVFVIGFNYLARDRGTLRWRVAISTWVMIAFISWVIWNTGGMQSPLFNLYLLVIILSAMTLGKLTTMLEIALMGAAYIYVAMHSTGEFSLMEFSRLMIFFAPFLLVAWVTALLAGDIQAGGLAFKSLAHTDEMTGLLNKRSLNVELEKAIQTAAERKSPLTVMMLDADNLKHTNDTFGHDAGDQLITHVASVLKGSLRASDIVCRYGGDEFVAVLPQMGLAKALEISERIRKAVALSPFQSREQALSTSVSVGFSTWPDHTKDLTQLMVLADASLYESKRKGRNQVTNAGQL
ncbi:MAG: GGDEF domain-containing protein [Pseudomonadota bacterium]